MSACGAEGEEAGLWGVRCEGLKDRGWQRGSGHERWSGDRGQGHGVRGTAEAWTLWQRTQGGNTRHGHGSSHVPLGALSLTPGLGTPLGWGHPWVGDTSCGLCCGDTGPCTDAPWCGHCRRLAPEFARAAALLRNGSDVGRLGKVDAVAQTALSTEFHIDAFPTLKLFRDGNRTHPVAYSGRAVRGAVRAGGRWGGDGEGVTASRQRLRGDGGVVAQWL